MSHYTVLVVGEDPEGQLAPYDENIEVPEYKVKKLSKDDKIDFLSYYKEKTSIDESITDMLNKFSHYYTIWGDSWNSGRWRMDENQEWYEYSTYNPFSKWDWYQLGGRWAGYFKCKPGVKDYTVGEKSFFREDDIDPGYCDQIRLKDIDIEGMRQDAREAGARYFDAVMKIVDKHGKPPYWRDILEKHGEANIDDARAEYQSHPAIVELRKQDLDLLFADIRDVLLDFDRDKYLERRAKGSLATFAVLKDGHWYEKGEMGWWGMTSNEMSDEEWHEKFDELIDQLPPETLLSLYDCHI